MLPSLFNFFLFVLPVHPLLSCFIQSFSVLTCLAHFSVTENWIFLCSNFTDWISLHYITLFSFFKPVLLKVTWFHSFPLSIPFACSQHSSIFPWLIVCFPPHHPILFPDPEWCNAGGDVWRFSRVLHNRGADGVDQTDGSGVLACDGGLHRGGLAPGFQLSSMKGLEEGGVKEFQLPEVLWQNFHRQG